MTTEAPPAGSPRPGAASIFLLFFKVSALTIGGGYAMVPVIGRALEKKAWVGEKDFYALFAQAQIFPGPFALNTSLLVGARLGGAAGAIAAFFGIVLPPFGSLLLVGGLLAGIGEAPLVKAFLAGAGATVPGLVAAMLFRMAKNRAWKPHRLVALFALAILLVAFPRLAVPIFFGGLALGYLMERRWAS